MWRNCDYTGNTEERKMPLWWLWPIILIDVIFREDVRNCQPKIYNTEYQDRPATPPQPPQNGPKPQMEWSNVVVNILKLARCCIRIATIFDPRIAQIWYFHSAPSSIGGLAPEHWYKLWTGKDCKDVNNGKHFLLQGQGGADLPGRTPHHHLSGRRDYEEYLVIYMHIKTPCSFLKPPIYLCDTCVLGWAHM